MECLKCGTERSMKDLQCPACGVIHAKAEAALVRENNKRFEEEQRLEKKAVRDQRIATITNYWMLISKRLNVKIIAALFFVGYISNLIIDIRQQNLEFKEASIKQEQANQLAQAEKAKAQVDADRKAYEAMAPERKAQHDAEIEVAKANQILQMKREFRKQQLSSQFSGWSGVHIKAERYLKERLKDPDSYEHIDTSYIDKGGYLLIIMRYRAANQFSPKAVHETTLRVDADNGNVLGIGR